MVGVNPWVAHANRFVYGEDPDVFRPERWLEDESTDGENKMEQYFFTVSTSNVISPSANTSPVVPKSSSSWYEVIYHSKPVVSILVGDLTGAPFHVGVPRVKDLGHHQCSLSLQRKGREKNEVC